MNTPEGGKRLRETMIKKHGSVEAWKAFMRENGRKGGIVVGTQGGFAAHLRCDGECNLDGIFGLYHKKSQCSGYIGGKKSKRGTKPEGNKPRAHKPVTESPSQTITINKEVPVTKHWYTFPSYKRGK